MGGGSRPAPERGSMSVELVVIAPALVLLLLLVAAGGRVVEVQGRIDGAARDAARAASIARSGAQADLWAQQAAQADLPAGSWCARGSVHTAVSGFPAAGVGAAGEAVTVTVTCDVNMSPFGVIGLRPTMLVTGQAVAPVDPFVCRDGTCP